MKKMVNVSVKPIMGIQIENPTPEQYLYDLCNRYVCTPITDRRLNELQFDLDRFESIYGKKLKFVLHNDKIEIKMARPTIIYLGEVLDNDKEHELLCDKKHGFDVKLIYEIKSHYQEKEVIAHNVTEVHYLYDSYTGEQVAIESNIHSTGFTRFLKHIEMIEISYASKRYNEL
jgi:hypothetical protein